MISSDQLFLPEVAPAGGLNLMEAPRASSRRLKTAGGEWFSEARFGMFVHYGLYSLLGRGEWSMYVERIPREEYNRLATDFRAERFDAEALVSLARRAGAGYVVLGARHHDGFCLWDTRTTDFNTAKTAAGRDLIREYVDACRRAGLRVGIYYSVMSWQWPAIFQGPVKDPKGWAAMVRETHEQVRELHTNYGRIDLLWYDGCVVPGLGDAGLRAKYWRARELNAMVRRLQPGILINDRAALPEDITTPEQHLTPAPRGRLWECCQTIGNHWGWHHADRDFKSQRRLLQEMIFCARHGGNYLLNVGPRADGTVPEEQASCMEALGRWLDVNGESIRGSERTPYTEAEHLLGAVTCRGRTLYFHLSEWPEEPARIAGIRARIESARLLSSEIELHVEQRADGTALISGLPISQPIDDIRVIALRLAEPPLRKAPPSLLVERDTGRHAPAEEPVQTIEDWTMDKCQRIRFRAPSAGLYDLELGIIARSATSLAIALDEITLGRPARVECGEYPITVRKRRLRLAEGTHLLRLQSGGEEFALPCWRLQSIWKPFGPRYWRTMGPFPTEFTSKGAEMHVREAFERSLPAEGAFDAGALYEGCGEELIGWRTSMLTEDIVNLARLCGGRESGVCFARMRVFSPEARDLDVLLGCDWWANLFVNGEVVRSRRSAKAFALDGAWFNGWKPIPARVHLEQGENVFLIKCHPGSIDNWFTFFVNDAGDLEFQP